MTGRKQKTRPPGSQEAVTALRDLGFDVYGLGIGGRVSVPAEAAVELAEALRKERSRMDETACMASEDSNMGQMMRAQLRREKERAELQKQDEPAWNPKGPIHGTD